jgi:hypothetical protein
MATIATSPRHPETFHHWWAWILAAVGLAFAVGAAVLVADAIRSGGDEPTTAAVSGEAGVLDEATPIHIAEPGVTTAYVGLNPAFDPDVGPSGLMEEATAIHVAEPGITTVYVGLNPAFDPDVGPSGLIDEATPMHIAAPGVTTVYLGNSGEMYAEE